jgi:Fe-S cluster biogenesis protein NfuA
MKRLTFEDMAQEVFCRFTGGCNDCEDALVTLRLDRLSRCKRAGLGLSK